ncbi:MAG: hypothetical protein K9N55_16640 [Phycisphaerae bacterium]|nr:hypothetical protein [Phycisphaerae bacterium]
MQTKGRIAIIHPHTTLRISLKDLIQCEAGYRIVFESDHPAISVDDLLSTASDIIITDGASLQAITQLTSLCSDQHVRNMPILVLSPSDEMVDIKSAFRMGAKGYIPLDQVALELIDAIGCLIAGQLYIGNALQTTLPSAIIQEILS